MRKTSRQLPLVVSASRRTDLVAHYPDYLIERLQKIGPSRIHTIVLWTKDPSNLLSHQALRQTLRETGQVFLHWTVTGLGGSWMEPNVPRWQEQVALLPDIAAFVGDARRIHWRYDPLVTAQREAETVSNANTSSFGLLADNIARTGVPAVHVSFVSMYAKVVKRLAKAGIEFTVYQEQDRRQLLLELTEAASQRGLQLLTCCEPGFPRQRCINGELLSLLHPEGEACRTDRAAGQRDGCGCTVSLDIGRYLPCPGQCVYCYAHPQR
jgi:hypothetical protein